MVLEEDPLGAVPPPGVPAVRGGCRQVLFSWALVSFPFVFIKDFH